ncbi:MAG: HEAT repeat domain-containing protein [Phycisphaerales bacterium]|jgi:hypothetical protein|nr:HEAT repeat domain-containing protein [Phycisphaerales bacterium]MBT7170767.1 HEAT repeat domain-containing protein [Phycisphaerales bacterium]
MKQAMTGLMLLAFVVGGCGDGSMNSTIKGWFNPAPKKTNQELVAQAFDEVDPDHRREALEVLGENDWALRDPYLKRYAQLTEPETEVDPTVRAVAVRLLGKAKDETYRSFVFAALEDPSEIVRSDACVVLEHWRAPAVPESLATMAIGDSSVDVRSRACEVLAHYPTEEAYAALHLALGDPEFLVRRSAHTALVLACDRDHGPERMDWPATLATLRTTPAPQPKTERSWWKPEQESRWNHENWFKKSNLDPDNLPEPAPEPAPTVEPAAPASIEPPAAIQLKDLMPMPAAESK